jgi:hypothetical protein
MLLVATPGVAAGQGSLFERLNLDRLRFMALGFSYGAMEPSQMEPTQAYSLHTDYGEVVPRWRVIFTATFWKSRYEDDIVRAFADSLDRSVTDPEGNADVIASGIAVSDIAVGADIRWMSPSQYVRFRPYLGANISAHVINAEGPLIDGTFMETALDNIATGVAAAAGVELLLLSHLSAGAEARLDLLSGIRYGSLRVGGTYMFDAVDLRQRDR